MANRCIALNMLKRVLGRLFRSYPNSFFFARVKVSPLSLTKVFHFSSVYACYVLVYYFSSLFIASLLILLRRLAIEQVQLHFLLFLFTCHFSKSWNYLIPTPPYFGKAMPVSHVYPSFYFS